MAASTVVSLINRLATSDDKLDCLEELKLLLSSLGPQELRNVVPNVSILPVFECLNTDDKMVSQHIGKPSVLNHFDRALHMRGIPNGCLKAYAKSLRAGEVLKCVAQQEVCCSVLERLLSALGCGLILENLHQEFIRWLQNGTPPVFSLCLSQLLRVSEESPELLSQSKELLVAVTAQLGGSDQGIAHLATSVLVRLGWCVSTLANHTRHTTLIGPSTGEGFQIDVSNPRMVSQHIGKPFVLHPIDQALHRRVIPDRLSTPMRHEGPEVQASSTASGLDTIYSGDVFDALQAVMATSDTVRYRVFQLVVELSTTSPEALEMSSRSGLLIKLVNEIYTEDILLQLNCLELLSDLAQSNHGLTFLDQQGVVSKLEQMMTTTDSSPFGAYLLPGLMKFFGGLARFHPKEVLGHFHTFVGMVFASIANQGDPSVKGLAIDTIGFIGSTPEGKSALDKQGSAMMECMGNLGAVIKNSPSDIRARAIQAVASLMKLQVSDQTEELLQITESWFSRLCTNPFDVLWNIAKQPFTDLRVSALQVFQSLALLPWGQQLMNNAAGYKEYLLDRAIETTKEGKEAKFLVAKIVAESPTVRDIFGEPYYVQLMEFYHQGPFYVRAQAEVAFEET